MGPWRAAQRFLAELIADGLLPEVNNLVVQLYGSLAKTGKGHATDMALLLGLSGEEPESVEPQRRVALIADIKASGRIMLAGKYQIAFEPEQDIHFLREQGRPDLVRFVLFGSDTWDPFVAALGELSP